MNKAKLELTRNWLIKAQHDLAAAYKLSANPDPYLDIAIFHCQQTAEKVVKGFLVFNDQRFQKTHDLRTLVNLAASFEAGFSAWMAPAEILTPYAAKFRYPDDILEPTLPEFEQALTAAEGLYNFVLSLLPVETHP